LSTDVCFLGKTGCAFRRPLPLLDALVAGQFTKGETMASASKLALDFLLRRTTMTSRQLPVPNFK
jgi:hypothetical protein